MHRTLARRTLSAILCVVFLCVGCTRALSSSQVAVLQQLYNNTGGPSWSNRAGWDLPFELWTDPCAEKDPSPSSLFGITCGNDNVVVMNLQSNNLVGTLPSQLFMELPTMTTILFSGNPGLGGTIPELPYGSPVTDVLLSSCAFTGQIPASLFASSLNQLQVQLNQLTGGLPGDVGNCTSLSTLIIGQNNLQIGPFPESIVNCAELTSLSAIDCGITSMPTNFSQLTYLTSLNLQGNQLSGSIPSSWCSFTALTEIYLQDNTQLSGSLPPCIANWSGLKYLVIENTHMSGTIPTFIFTAFPSLLGLYLSGSQFSGTIPDMFHLLSLTHAEFNGNNVKNDPVYSGPFPNSLLRLKSLQTLSIQYTQIEGPTVGFEELENIQVITLSSNPNMAFPFPSVLLTTLWAVPMYVTGATRQLLIENMPLTGVIPQIDGGVVYNVSTTGGFGFTQTQITGYIPNSTLEWISPSLQTNAFKGCTYLLYPVKSWMLPLTNNFRGMQFTLDGAFNGVSSFSMSGGEMLGISGNSFVDIPGLLFCGFCVSRNTVACMETDLNSLSPSERSGNLTFTAANQSLPGVMFCATPSVTTNESIAVALYYIGPAYGTSTEYYMVSSNSIDVTFYNPRPVVSNLLPNHGRIEGCTVVLAQGSGFLNAPNMTLLVGSSIWATGGIVLNDSFVHFLIPSANESAFNTPYNFPENTQLAVSLFAAGNLNIAAHSTATYEFSSTCNTPLVLCTNGFEDPEQCPRPLCRCFSEGTCTIPNGTTEYQCQCTAGFGGEGCAECQPNYFGAQCAACICDHGVCDDGVSGSGACTCESGYLGTSCSVSKWGLGLGVSIGFVSVALAAFLIRKRMRRSSCGDGGYESPLNAMTDK